MVKVMGRLAPQDRYKAALAIKFCKGKLAEFRSDERRKVIVVYWSR